MLTNAASQYDDGEYMVINDNMTPNSIAEVIEPSLRQEAEAFLKHEVADKMKDCEVRKSQLDMMAACSEIIEDGGTMLAEAGTGTGKTFAYLIPLILSGKKTIVATRTKNLQDQLATKDLAFLSSLRTFSYAVAKGRGNYLCMRRLNTFVPSNEEEAIAVRSILEWSAATETGDFEEYRERKSSLHEKVCSDSDACRKSQCLFNRKCFYGASGFLMGLYNI